MLRALGIPVTPGKLKAFERIPLPILVAVLRAWARTKHFDTIATRHTLAAFDEMEMISTDFQALARSTTVATPALDTLHAGLVNWKGYTMASRHSRRSSMTRRTTRKRAPLSRDRVLRAAMELADEGGVGALTMHQIGSRLGVEAMSLYRHVRNKDEILDGLVDLVFAEIELPVDRSSWRLVLRARSISTRAALRRHPWAITLMESRMAPGPANLRSHDEMLGVLLDAGFSAALATHAYNLVDSYVLGFALQEVHLPFADAEELAEVGDQLLAQVPADDYPSFVRVGTELLASGFDYGDEFEFGLDLIVDGIERALHGA